MDCKSILENVKEQYERLTRGKKIGITILIVGFLVVCAYGLGCTWGEALYYIVN